MTTLVKQMSLAVRVQRAKRGSEVRSRNWHQRKGSSSLAGGVDRDDFSFTLIWLNYPRTHTEVEYLPRGPLLVGNEENNMEKTRSENGPSEQGHAYVDMWLLMVMSGVPGGRLSTSLTSFSCSYTVVRLNTCM